MIIEYQNACKACTDSINTSGGEIIERWIKPQLGQFRVDVDAGFNDQRRYYTIGAVIRDCHGHIVATMASKIRNPRSSLRGELSAILHELIFCK